jgi:putative transposase
MKFYTEQLFHIYNQGNNSQVIFFSDENYNFFLWKMKAFLLPFGDLVAYCLMPTHFHWQFYVRHIKIERRVLQEHVDEIEFLRRVNKYGVNAQIVERKASRMAKEGIMISLNEAIGILQKSYTEAINNQKDWTGSLFRKRCKAKDGWEEGFITLKKSGKRLDHRFKPGTDYAYNCFCYIHNNPRKAGLVNRNIDWNYSSAKDYAGLTKWSLCNLKLGRNIINFL